MPANIQKLRRSLKKNPLNTVTLLKLADALRNIGQAAQALNVYRKLIEISPDNYHGLNNYGALLRHNGDIDTSLEILSRANQLAPNNPIIMTNLGNTYLSMGRSDLGINMAKNAILVEPGFFDAYEVLGNAQVSAGDYDSALTTYRRALELRPDDFNTKVSMVRTYHYMGDNEHAYKILEPLIESNRLECASVYFRVGSTMGMGKEAADYIYKNLSRANKDKMADSALASLYFCLGNHHDKSAEYDLAIKQYNIANKRCNKVYDHNETIRHFDNIISTFSRNKLETEPRSLINSDKPVFIVGMPRSGTSLAEKILDSHPQVFGAGELNNIDITVREAKQYAPHLRYPDTIDSLDAKILTKRANSYLDHINKISGDAIRTIDKMPHNFMYIGFILRLFPNATIIHCQRHPLDTCLSCYFSEFGTSGHTYAYNLDDLGDYYLQYHRLMSHWSELYKDRILELKYEELVANQETISRKLISHCGLEWDDKCLAFSENKRRTHTLSYEQVNKPIYSSSVDRWKHYEADIQPLIDKLGDVIDATSYSAV